MLFASTETIPNILNSLGLCIGINMIFTIFSSLMTFCIKTCTDNYEFHMCFFSLFSFIICTLLTFASSLYMIFITPDTIDYLGNMIIVILGIISLGLHVLILIIFNIYYWYVDYKIRKAQVQNIIQPEQI